MTPSEKLFRCRDIWRKMMEDKASGERQVIKLMQHPDTTPEQLADCRRVMLSVEDLMRSGVTALRRAYPARAGSFTNPPWWADEYNRYEVKQ